MVTKYLSIAYCYPYMFLFIRKNKLIYCHNSCSTDLSCRVCWGVLNDCLVYNRFNILLLVWNCVLYENINIFSFYHSFYFLCAKYKSCLLVNELKFDERWVHNHHFRYDECSFIMDLNYSIYIESIRCMWLVNRFHSHCTSKLNQHSFWNIDLYSRLRIVLPNDF